MCGVFDICVVGLQVVEETLTLVAGMGGTTGAGNMSFMRTMRILRLIRVLRIIRIVRFMDELRTLVVSIVKSMKSLFWTLSLLALGIYVVGIYFTQVVLDYRLATQDYAPSTLSDHFGGLALSMMSLYQAMSGGVDWTDLSTPLIHDISAFQGVIIALYIGFTVLALTNVVTGVFVEGALKSAEQEEEAVMLETLRQMMKKDGTNGMLSRDNFEQLLHEPGMVAYLRSISVDAAEADLLFSLIDEDSSGMIDYEEFVGGCMRIRGSARAIDSILLLHEVVETRRDLEVYRHWAEEQMAAIADSVQARRVPLTAYFQQAPSMPSESENVFYSRADSEGENE